MRMFRVTVNGNQYEVGIEELTGGQPAPVPVRPATAPTASAAASPGASTRQETAPAPADSGTVSAAIPGTILDVRVKVGQRVKRGDILVILEAMKMENEIMAPHDGQVASVHVEKGTAVNVGSPLVVLC